MAKAKAAPEVDTDDLRDLIASARAIASALGCIGEDAGLDHDALWRLGNEIDVKLTHALAILDRFDEQESKRAA
ncbi:MAG: hypothetical protein Q7J84_13875 [Sulfuricaulis sp.]|nr:hypothetical protein [Sulfuricaulis sp.]